LHYGYLTCIFTISFYKYTQGTANANDAENARPETSSPDKRENPFSSTGATADNVNYEDGVSRQNNSPAPPTVGRMLSSGGVDGGPVNGASSGDNNSSDGGRTSSAGGE